MQRLSAEFNSTRISSRQNVWVNPTTGGPRTIYEPLPTDGCIRVIELQPGKYDDEVVCTLGVHRLEDPAEYAAISYVWGNPQDTIDIQCNHITVPITVNLADALRQFRDQQEVRKLWADALCINQNDDEEKGHQVTHMGDVYSNAKCVLVWLGRDLEGVAEDCFRVIRIVNNYLNNFFVSKGHYKGLPRLSEQHTIPVDRETWKHIIDLIRLPWFRRVWTVQECALAKSCRLFRGAANTDIADVIEISVWLNIYSDLNLLLRTYGFARFTHPATLFMNAYCYFLKEQSWQHSRPILRYENERFPRSCFATVLSRTNHLSASDDRDYVYAYLGCIYAAGDDNLPVLEADYSIPASDVYYNVACALLQIPREGPWVLSSVYRKTRRRVTYLEYPTWVPQWCVKGLPMRADPMLDFRAGGPADRFYARIVAKPHLQLTGFVFDSIIWNSSDLQSSDFLLTPDMWSSSTKAADKPFIDILWQALESAALQQQISVREDDFTLTLLTGYNKASVISRMRGHRRMMDMYRKVVRDSVKQHARGQTPNSNDISFEAATSVAKQLRRASQSHCLFLTRGGRVGLGPGGATEVGDSCCIFLGATVPFILAPGDEGRYRLVGECYTHGVMGGELVNKFEATNIILE